MEEKSCLSTYGRRYVGAYFKKDLNMREKENVCS